MFAVFVRCVNILEESSDEIDGNDRTLRGMRPAETAESTKFMSVLQSRFGPEHEDHFSLFEKKSVRQLRTIE